jgi:hypothetical protein
VEGAVSELSRRGFLQRLGAAYGLAVIGCSRKGDWFAQEHVCIHIYHPAEFVAAPLTEKTRRPSTRKDTEEYFGVGLPELVVCTTRIALLDLFQYFWPFSRDDLAQLEQSIEIQFSKAIVRGAADIEDFASYLRAHSSDIAPSHASSAVIFTFNEFTRYWTPDVIAASRQAGVREFVVFKDPTQPPYICTCPAIQKGKFKRPPP